MQKKTLFIFPLFFTLGFLVTRCASTNKTTTSSTIKIAPISNLTREEAQGRKQLISNPRYELKFDFDAKNGFYTATADINFKMRSKSSTFLDFKGGEIISLTINDIATTPAYQNSRIQLASDSMREGDNHIIINYKQTFSKNGRGIYRFQDPEDNKVYLWTKLEPFDANQVFPCFDQPDLKSIFSINVSAPTDWKVIFTTLESQKKVVGGKTEWVFPESPLMSTYLFSIHAGNYEVWSDRYKNIPLRVFVRASLKKYVDPKFWFSITKKGFQFFDKEFAYNYPFKKYDQLIVPEFSSGGMENIAAVNYSERFITRGTPSREELENLANVMLHEMAHMWFGDLVTMTWWDELWLNESFATFMAYNALEKATEFKESWSNFQKRGKLAAYIEDQYPTTHPVSTEVPDISATFNHFDAITYSKGASVLRQLSYYIGEDNFRKGVQNYFKKYAYSNTNLFQFIAELEKTSNSDLRMWSLTWLRNSGLDTIKITPECSNSKLTSIAFEMISPNPSHHPRPHRVPITLYKWTGKKMDSWTIEDFKSDGGMQTRTITSSMTCPDFILPNATDMTYLKVFLDPKQINWAKEHLDKISSSQARGVFWNQAYLNLRDGTVKIDDFIKLFSAQFKQEKNQIINQQFFTYWSAIAKYLPQKTALELSVRSKALDLLESYFWNQITTSQDPLWKKTLFVNWVRRIESEDSQALVIEILNDKINLKPLILDQDIRWQMVQRLAALGHSQATELIAKTKANDPTETGFKSYLAAEASKPIINEKTKWLEQMNRPDSNWSLARKQSIIYSLFPSTPKQTQLRYQFREQFYKTMSVLDKRNEDISYNRTYVDLAPSGCDEALITEFDNFISQQDWNVVTKKSLIIQNQENKICARVQIR